VVQLSYWLLLKSFFHSHNLTQAVVMNLEQLFQNFRKSRKYLQNVTNDTLRFYDVSSRAVDRHWKISDTSEINKEVLDEMLVSMRNHC
jgi:uncharacterized membrane protein